ncbi:hypothetical protein B0H14DRAFT_2604715 [Mycena olivaceomarginata]|nr:hypothetical protein B0H14DRAFT_2604715 [Mycena olivaceomarginata]
MNCFHGFYVYSLLDWLINGRSGVGPDMGRPSRTPTFSQFLAFHTNNRGPRRRPEATRKRPGGGRGPEKASRRRLMEGGPWGRLIRSGCDRAAQCSLRFTSSMAEVTGGARSDAADEHTCGAGAQRRRQRWCRPHQERASQQKDRLGTAPLPRNQGSGGGVDKGGGQVIEREAAVLMPQIRKIIPGFSGQARLSGGRRENLDGSRNRRRRRRRRGWRRRREGVDPVQIIEIIHQRRSKNGSRHGGSWVQQILKARVQVALFLGASNTDEGTRIARIACFEGGG